MKIFAVLATSCKGLSSHRSPWPAFSPGAGCCCFATPGQCVIKEQKRLASVSVRRGAKEGVLGVCGGRPEVLLEQDDSAGTWAGSDVLYYMASNKEEKKGRQM